MTTKKICIITSPFLLNASLHPLSNLTQILSSLSDNLTVITGGSSIDLKFPSNTHACLINSHNINNMLKPLTLLYYHFKIVIKIASLKNIDICIFFMGERTLTIPILMSKLLGKKVIYMSSGSLINPFQKNKNISVKIMNIFENINLLLSDRIIIYSKRLILEKDYKRFENKIIIAHEHYKDTEKFKIETDINSRNILIGYIGRFSKEKGILNFLKAIPIIINQNSDSKFIIIGEGELQDIITEFINQNSLSNKVEVMGWIPHDDLKIYLNKIKLIIVPSYTEGIPNVMLEAMACGSIVLATPVGAIPDIIRDGESGFIMEDNSPLSIASNINRALNYPDLEKIIKNSRHILVNDFNFDKNVDDWRQILEIF
jgi:glycosyltransferase involved in cell wall biosynthesis